MFWQSFIDGWTSLAQPRVFIATLVLIVLYLGYSHTLRKTTSLKESEGAAAPGCLLQVLATLIEGFAIGIYVLILLPVLLEKMSSSNLPDLQSFALLAIRAGIIATLVLTLLSFLPYLRSFMARRPGLQIFLMGMTVFRLVAPLYVERSALGALGVRPEFPGFGLSLLYLAVALLFSEIVFWLSQWVPPKLGAAPASISHQATLSGIDILTGIIPLLMYIQYVGNSMGR